MWIDYATLAAAVAAFLAAIYAVHTADKALMVASDAVKLAIAARQYANWTQQRREPVPNPLDMGDA